MAIISTIIIVLLIRERIVLQVTPDNFINKKFSNHNNLS